MTPNHMGFCEILGLVTGDVFPAFAPKIELKKVPIVGKMARGLQSIYIDRFGSKTNRDFIVNQIIAHQRKISVEKLPFNPLCIFPEGTTTNGTGIRLFRRGAFAAMLPVVPIVCEISTYGPVNPTYDSIEFTTLVVLLLSSFSMHLVSIRILPVFKPNQYLQETHA